MDKDIRPSIFGDEAIKSLTQGYKELNDAVSSTLGPKGKNVVIYRGIYNTPITTKDGITVARAFATQGRFEKIGAQLAKDISGRSNDIVGDGSTTSTLLGYSMVSEGLKQVSRGAQPVWVKKGMEEAVKKTLDMLTDMAIPIRTEEAVRNIASISANNDEALGALIAEAVTKVGDNGTVTTAKNSKHGVYVDYSEGYSWTNGFASDLLHIKGNPNKGTTYENCRILVVNDTLDTPTQALAEFLKPFLEDPNPEPLVFIARDSTGMVLANFTQWVGTNCKPIGIINAPFYGDTQTEVLKDIAALCGCKMINDLAQPFTSENIGSCEKLEVKKNLTIIYEGVGSQEAIDERIAIIQEDLSKCDVDIDKEDLDVRLAKLSNSIATIHVGAKSEFEQEEMIHRIEDALSATRAAIEEGIVPGGGRALHICANKLTTNLKGDELKGFEIIRKALLAPVIKISENGGYNPKKIIKNIEKISKNELNSFIGFDAKEGVYCDLIEKGITDPVKVTKTALESAQSIAGMLMLTSGVIIPS